ncbi:MAG: TraC family protein [Candidatus Pacebacteria bacterium]|nr:TraC family protein [Candidatus Paceibacterota bacterium]
MATPTKSTQEFVPVKEIRDGVVVLKDGSMRMILMASTLNFALKSEEEQNAITLQYQNFLNSLDFTVQFFIQSRKLNIDPYLSMLGEAQKNQDNDLMEIQIREYVEFIKNFVKMSNVVSKNFYIAVPYTTAAMEVQKGVLGNIVGNFSKKTAKEASDRFEENKLQLQQRADIVAQGLARVGVRVVPLNTEELIELFYELFNPGESEKARMQ